MCVIAVVKNKRPSDEMVRRMWSANKDGGGIAYRDVIEDEKTGEKVPVVRWKKGLDLTDMLEAARDLPVPFIMHFRKRSVGATSDELCHPFPVDPDSSLDLEGVTTGYVLFHNGTFKDWHGYFFNFITMRGMKFPIGAYSDSRALAIMAAEAGVGIMDCVGAKGVAFSPTEIDIFEGRDNIEDWKKVEDIWVSNDKFMPTVTTYNHNTATVVSYPHAQQQQARALLPKKRESRVYCRDANCTEKNGLDEEGYCTKHSKKNSLLQQGSPSTQTTTTTSLTEGSALPVRRKPKPGLIESPFQETVDELRKVAETQGPLAAASMALAALNATPTRLSKSQWKRLNMEFSQMEAAQRKARLQQLEETFSGIVP